MKSHRLFLILILIVAGGLRYAYLDQVRHNIDHAYPIWQALATLERGELPLVGQATSVLFANPALTGYLYLPVVALTRSPAAVYIVVVALNTLAVFACYLATKSLLPDRRLALIAAWLMAVNPWVIEYSRTTWVQSLMPFFACTIAWLLWSGLKGKPRRVLPALLLVTVFTQTYLLAFAIVLPVAVLLFIYRRCVTWRSAAIGAAVFVCVTGIYGAALLNQQATTTADRLETFSEAPAQLSVTALSHAARLVNGAEYAQARTTDTTLQAVEPAARYLLLIPLIVGVIAAVLSIYRRDGRHDAGVMVLVWWAVPIMLMSYTGNPVHPFYLLLGLPAGYVLAAWGAGTLLRGRVLSTVIITLLALFGVVMGLSSIGYARATAAAPGEQRLVGLPLGDGMRLGSLVCRRLPSNGTVYASVSPWILSSLAGELVPVTLDTRAPLVSIIPEDGGLYITTGQSASQPPPLATTVDTMTLSDGTVITLHAYPTSIDVTENAETLNVPTAEGLTLIGYRLRPRREAGTWNLVLYWRVDAIATGGNFGAFAHIYNADGERIAIVDGQVVPTDRWQIGDTHIHRMTFAAEAPFTVHVGQYDSSAGVNMTLLPPDQAPTTTLELPHDDES